MSVPSSGAHPLLVSPRHARVVDGSLLGDLPGPSATDAARPGAAPADRVVPDPALPAVADLLGPRAAERLDAGPVEGRVRSARPRHVTYRPEHGLLVRYDAEVEGPDGTVTAERLVAACGDLRPEGIRPTGGVAVWRMADDPALPGLRSALDPATVRELLASLGAPGPVRLHLRVHRPLRRALVEVTTPGARAFLRVLPPDRAGDTHDLHRRLTAAGLPVPPTHGWDASLGIVVIGALPGDDLRPRLRTGAGSFPPARGLLDLLGALPDDVGRRQRRGWGHRPSARLLRRVAPELEGALDHLVDALDDHERHVAELPDAPVHGDLHEAQLRVEDDRIVGLLDIDTVGRGRRVDDLGNVLGHLTTLALSARRPERITADIRRLFDAFATEHGPDALRGAAAASVLGLATGPFRVQQDGWRAATATRVGLAEAWLTGELPG